MDMKQILLHWSTNLLIKMTSGGRVKNDNILNILKDFAEELHKTLIRKFKKRKEQCFYRQYWQC